MSGNLWEEASELAERVLSVTSGIDLPHHNSWWLTVILFLNSSNERMQACRLLLEGGLCDSSIIVTRSLFELAVNISYINQDVATRLPKYLLHGGIPSTP